MVLNLSNESFDYQKKEEQKTQQAKRKKEREIKLNQSNRE